MFTVIFIITVNSNRKTFNTNCCRRYILLFYYMQNTSHNVANSKLDGVGCDELLPNGADGVGEGGRLVGAAHPVLGHHGPQQLRRLPRYGVRALHLPALELEDEVADERLHVRHGGARGGERREADEGFGFRGRIGGEEAGRG
uniref:Translation initiation factor eIF-2B beta subunit n=1 Tax=Arundo donax TaxID=35708 RepID=A0A0A9GCS7_ARUDO